MMNQGTSAVGVMRLTVRYFAAIREAIGCDREVIEGAVTTTGDLRDALVAMGGARAASLARGRAVRIALNQMICDESAALVQGCEVASFPPVTGG